MERERLTLRSRRGRLRRLLAVVIFAGTLTFGCVGLGQLVEPEEVTPPVLEEETVEAIEVLPTLTPDPEPKEIEVTPEDVPGPQLERGFLAALYEQTNPRVVSIRVYVEEGGMPAQGAGSGFVLDEEGHIVTNEHVVRPAEVVTVIFHTGLEVRADVVGLDPHSDLAILLVDELPEDVASLPLGDSEAVAPGDWVVAIGNPFGLGGSMSLGIVSAVGRTIPTEATPFQIPQAIQTDAAINPGNSGGPLLNLDGAVVGVNAIIATDDGGLGSGVGFAIPAGVVRRVAPALIEEGAYVWPWIGVSGLPVNLAVQEANNLEKQQGAYIAEIVSGSPAEEAGLQGATRIEQVFGLDVPVGGDVIIEANGDPIADFADLLVSVAFRQPGDTVDFTILRDGERQQVTVELGARPVTPDP